MLALDGEVKTGRKTEKEIERRRGQVTEKERGGGVGWGWGVVDREIETERDGA